MIKPIETYYNGYRFRSRLEARWAVFFDAAGIKYEYEPEGFTIDDGIKYLPDFYLPEFDIWCEVKANREGIDADILKAAKLITWGGPAKAVIILSEVPEYSKLNGIPHFPVLYFSVRHGVATGWAYFWVNYNKQVKLTISEKSSGYRNFMFLSEGEISWSGGVTDILPKYNYELKFTTYCDLKNKIINTINCKDCDKCHCNACDYYSNAKIVESLSKARQARFEHGERG